MKKIYLLLIAALYLTAANAQTRNIDVSLKCYYQIHTTGQTQPNNINEITNGTRILFDANGDYQVWLCFQVFNAGATAADSISATDTLHLIGPGPMPKVSGWGMMIHQNDSSGLTWSGAMPISLPTLTTPGSPWDDSISKAVPLFWCDSIWFTSDVNDPNPIDETGRTNNNGHCHNIIADGWMLDVDNDIRISGNGMLVYPNPSYGQLNVMYNFGTNNSGVITIVDVTGKVVYTQQLDANLKGLQTIPVNVKGLANGLYSLRLATGNKVAVEKVYINN